LNCLISINERIWHLYLQKAPSKRSISRSTISKKKLSISS
jgi:hypothetical protein